MTGTVAWQALRLGYEYDFIVKRRVLAGFVVEADRTNVQVRLHSASANELTSSSVPTIPAVGGMVRVYPAANFSLTGELTGLEVPDRPNQEYGGHYLNLETDGTLNVTKNVGAQIGFRLIDIRHLGQSDSGTLKLKGLFLRIVVRR